MCQVYSTNDKIDFFLARPLNIQWSLCYNFIHVYFIQFANEKVGLNTILISQFKTYLFLTFIIPKFLKFCIWFTINPIEGSIVSKWNLNKILNLLPCVFLKICLFLNLIFFQQLFLYTLQCFHPQVTNDLHEVATIIFHLCCPFVLCCSYHLMSLDVDDENEYKT
jgi:hypothetical protein